MFRGEIGYLNLPVVNVKKRISPRNTAKFHRENRIFQRKNKSIKRLNFPLAGEISRWFRREKSQAISSNCAKVGFQP